MDEKVILQVLAEQREEMSGYDVSGWISRPEEDFFEWDSDMAQVVIGVRRSGKSTLCHKALIQHGVKYGYSDLDDDRVVVYPECLAVNFMTGRVSDNKFYSLTS